MGFANQNFSKKKIQDPLTTTFQKVETTVGITALKSQVESTYSVAFVVTGVEPNWSVTLTGPRNNFERAMNFLFPKRDDGSLNNFQTLP